MDTIAWTITDHVCRACLGRVLVRTGDDGQPVARCADCGFSAVGDHTAICACSHPKGGRHAWVRCIPNPDKSAAFPQEIVLEAGDGKVFT